MKVNEPTTNNEIVMEEDAVLVSQTSLKGILTKANREFIEISGFSREELI